MDIRWSDRCRCDHTSKGRSVRTETLLHADKSIDAMLLAVKLLISAGLIVLATELAKRSTLAGGIILSLPLTSVIALCWVWLESKSSQKVSDLSMSTLWMVIPSLVFFPT